MGFRPGGDRHAIQEVVFVANLTRPFTPEELSRIEEIYEERWKADLPKKHTPTPFNVVLNGMVAASPAQAQLIFDAYRRDGALDWRLNVNGEWIAVNCLSYTRWNEVWARAKSYLVDALEVCGESNPITAISLQYIDMFVWEGGVDDYDLHTLLKSDSDLLSGNIFGKGPLWHQHSGWFEPTHAPIAGRCLVRTHLEGVQQEKGYAVKADTFLNVTLDSPISLSTIDDDDQRERVEAGFSILHVQNKKMLERFLSDEMANRILLNG